MTKYRRFKIKLKLTPRQYVFIECSLELAQDLKAVNKFKEYFSKEIMFSDIQTYLKSKGIDSTLASQCADEISDAYPSIAEELDKEEFAPYSEYVEEDYGFNT